MSRDIKLFNVHLLKIVPRVGFLDNMVSDLRNFGTLLGKKALTNAAVFFC